MNADTIREMIEQGLPGAEVEVLGDDGAHFEATIVSAQFEGKGLVARHRMVYNTLGDAMQSAIHALSMKTLTPQQAESQTQSQTQS